MLRHLAITPPIIGRIAIGHITEKNGKRLPERDDFFTVTTQVQTREGWILHPLHQKLAESSVNKKIRSIPVSVLFNDPGLNLRANYSCFDRSTGRPLCQGNGETAKRITQDGMQTIPCPSPDGCEVGQTNGCKPFGRLTVAIEGQEDPLGAFVFRTTGWNSIRTLAGRLSYLNAVSGGLLSCMPLTLKLRGKSTTQSYGTPIYYVDLVVREGLTLAEAVQQAKKTSEERQAAGIDQNGLEEAARSGFANGAFEEADEDVSAVLEEFYTPEGEQAEGQSSQRDDQPPGDSGQLGNRPKPSGLRRKLDEKQATAGRS